MKAITHHPMRIKAARIVLALLLLVLSRQCFSAPSAVNLEDFIADTDLEMCGEFQNYQAKGESQTLRSSLVVENDFLFNVQLVFKKDGQWNQKSIDAKDKTTVDLDGGALVAVIDPAIRICVGVFETPQSQSCAAFHLAEVTREFPFANDGKRLKGNDASCKGELSAPKTQKSTSRNDDPWAEENYVPSTWWKEIVQCPSEQRWSELDFLQGYQLGQEFDEKFDEIGEAFPYSDSDAMLFCYESLSPDFSVELKALRPWVVKRLEEVNALQKKVESSRATGDLDQRSERWVYSVLNTLDKRLRNLSYFIDEQSEMGVQSWKLKDESYVALYDVVLFMQSFRVAQNTYNSNLR
ncbi:hypothetical protein N9V92_06170 [Luminiphilus sp.]|nr:hypothetical protein [Luminiphilus sp.]